MTTRLDVHGATSIGKVRKVNQDQFLVAELTKTLKVVGTSLPGADGAQAHSNVQAMLLAVADGVGGSAAGERASALAVRAMADYALRVMPLFDDPNKPPSRPVTSMLDSAARRADVSITDEGDKVPEEKGMATTLTLAYVVGLRVHGVHVGDSRAYLVRDGKPTRLTRDHNIAQRLVDEGVMTPEAAERSRMRHVLWNSLGGQKGVTPDTFDLWIQPGDALVLCTDGLNKHVDEPTIGRIVAESKSADAACLRLVQAADEGGGTDNTAVVVAIVPRAA
jgi:PPM family protein phosphatase